MRINHEQGYQTLYAHLVEQPLVKVGDRVRAGQVIGYSGKVGNATLPHVHFAISRNGTRIKIPQVDFGTWVSKNASIPGEFADLPVLVPVLEPFEVKVISSDLPVLATPAPEGQKRGALPIDSTWKVGGSKGGFFEISFEGSVGYIANSGVVPTPSKLFGIRTSSEVSARADASATAREVTTFRAGAILNAFEEKNGYFRTHWRNGNSFFQYVWVPVSAAIRTTEFRMLGTLAPTVMLRGGPGNEFPSVQTLKFDAYGPGYIVRKIVNGWYDVGDHRWFPGWQTIRE